VPRSIPKSIRGRDRSTSAIKRRCSPAKNLQLIAMAVLAVLAATAAAQRPSAQSSAEEYQVKAAFMFHFAQFVEWPSGAFKDTNDPLTYCTVGEDPFQGALEQSLNGKLIGTRRARILHLKQARQFQDCQVVFIGTTERKEISTILAALKGAPILTVGDQADFVKDGGMIGFCLEDKKIRFEINLDAASDANLRISARLLALAKAVVGSSRGT
jgi:YfiR/HmsC-like